MAADYPSGLTSKALMGQAQDNISSTINQAGGLTAVATTVTLASGSAFPTSGYIRIDTETMKYTGKSSNDLTGLTRGLFGTSAAAHTNGTSVELTNSGGYIDELQEEVIALQTKVGVDSSAVTTTHDYLIGNVWTAYTPTIAGSGSNPTFTNKNGYYNVNGKLLTVFIESGPVTDNGSGYYSWSLPAGFTADTTVCKISTIVDADTGSFTLKMPLGTAHMSNYAAVWQKVAEMQVVLLTSTTVGLVINSGTASRANGLGSADTLATVSAYVNLQFQVATT